MNPKVDKFLDKAKNWKPETEKLRSIILECALVEDIKGESLVIHSTTEMWF